MSEQAQETTLRDTIAAAVDQAEADTAAAAPEAPAPTAAEAAPVETQPTEPAKPGRTAGRPRDEHGRLLPGKPIKEDQPSSAAQPLQATTPNKPKEAPSATAAAEPQAAPQAAERFPSTWKRELQAKWAAIDPDVRAEIMRRESDAARGVSTYKSEWDKARPMIEAVAPFMPILQHHNITPDRWITQLGTAHQHLALGTPEQKLQAFAKLAQDYGVPLQALQPQDGQQPQQQFQQPQARFTAPPPVTQEEVRRMMAEESVRMMGLQEVNRLSSDGQHPHLSEVRETMAQLLESGLIPESDDALHQAYEAALRLPKHADLYQAEQERLRQADEEKQSRDKAALAQRARSQAVSVRSSTPSANMAVASGPKGLRDTLSEAFDAHMGGRV